MTEEIDLSHIPSRHDEMEFFLAHREAWSREHPCEWVAIVGDQIVGIGPDLDAVLRQAREAGHDYPFIGGLMDPVLIDAAFGFSQAVL